VARAASARQQTCGPAADSFLDRLPADGWHASDDSDSSWHVVRSSLAIIRILLVSARELQHAQHGA
jgi:hypothetical protein